MTDAETLLWRRLRRSGSGVKFRRQHPWGPYVLDFYAERVHLAIEVDGGQHYTPEGLAKDAERTKFLESAGIQVLRFSDTEVLVETNAVLEAIWEATRGYDHSP